MDKSLYVFVEDSCSEKHFGLSIAVYYTISSHYYYYHNFQIIYMMPELSPEEKEDIIKNPFETKSDSFYFVGDRLVMHNKALYSYA